MKSVRTLSVIIILSLILALVPSAFAAAPPGNWVSGISCQNLTASQANITLSFYEEGNATPVLEYTDPTPIPANGSRNYFTPSSPPGVPDGFLGSVVVSSTAELACNVNTQTSSTGTQSDPYRIGTSSGFSDDGDATVESGEPAGTMYAPQVMKNLAGTWSSYIAVQNTTGSDVSVEVSYKDRFGVDVPAATESMSIPGNSNHVFYQTDNASLPNGFLGAATVASSGGEKLAVTVNFYNSASSYTTAQFHSYNGLSVGANELLVPRVVRSFYGYNSGVSIQNVGGGPTTVSIAFNFAGTTYNYNSPTINAGAALALYLPDVAALNPVDAIPVNNRFGSATIAAAAGGEIVAIVNEDNRGGTGIPAERVGQGTTYNAIPSGAETNVVLLPQVPRKAGGIFSGGFQVSNTTGTAGTCDIVYNSDTDANQNDVPLPANGSISIYAPNVTNLNDGYNASVTVTCTQPAVGISNLAVEPGSGRFGDSFTQNNAINQ